MAMTTPNERVSVSEVLDDRALSEQLEVTEAGGPSGLRRSLVWVVALVVVLAVGGGAYALLSSTVGEGDTDSMLTHEVTRGELVVTITEDGTVESADNTEIKCEIAGGTTILWLIEDGTHVEAGTVLAKLDSSKLEEDISQQKITVEKARASYVQAEKDLNVAEISIREYLEGTYQRDLQDMEAQITIAMETLRSAENTLQYTQRMFRKGYVTALQLEAKEFAVERAKLELKSLETAKRVLIDFTKAKTMEDLNSQKATAEAKKNSEKAALDLEESRLKRLEAQLEKCVIKAPRKGMVVHANDMSFHGPRGSSGPQIEEGAAIREQQDIFRFPDLAQMQVKTAVHETKVDKLRPGMPAKVRVQGREFTGSVVSVANQPEPTSFFSSNVKEYAVIVKIDGQHEDLRPGLTAEVEILVAHRENVLTLPVAAIMEQAGRFYCWVKNDGQTERRPLKLGWTNNKAVEIEDGVAEGDLVVMNPRTVIEEARGDEYGSEAKEGVEGFGNGAKSGDEGAAAKPGRPGEGPGASPGQAGPGGAAERSPGPPSGEGAEGGPRRKPGGGFPSFSDLDKDGDGRLSREEAPGRMAERFDMLDTNKDGFVDQSELEALRARFGGGRRGGGPPPGMEGGGSFGPPRGQP